MLPTPYLIIDAAVVARNITRLAEYARRHDLALRPHSKTHKSRYFAAEQVEAGAAGVTVAKVGELECLADSASDFLMAYPAVDAARCRRLAVLAQRVTVTVAVDSVQAVRNIASAARERDAEIGILIELDVGFGRTGVASPTAAVELAKEADAENGLGLRGLMFYPGHVGEPPDRQRQPLERISALLAETRDLFRKAGLCCEVISGGSTATAYQSHLIEPLTEIRPGTYIFNDMNTVRGGFCTLEDCAARIVATVVSDAVAGQVVVDAGTKTLTSDRCSTHPDSGHGLVVEYPDAKLTRLTEEHGQVDVSRCPQRPEIGEQVTIIPNHICPCVNLQDTIHLRRPDGSLEQIVVDARGQLS